MNQQRLLDAAVRAAQWMLKNQNTDTMDANHGRFLWEYVPATGKKSWTTGWDSGCAAMALLALWKRTGQEVYIAAAKRAAEYIMSLQLLDHRNKLFYGAFREVTPQWKDLCPRDSASAAWALCWLYEATKNPEYLDRAVLFGDWLIDYGMYDHWPRWALFMNGRDHSYCRGSFQSGCGLFFYDLFRLTHDPRYIDRGMRPIAEIYCRDFVNADGSITVQRDCFGNQPVQKVKAGVLEAGMHNFNDDFGAAMLLQAAELLNRDDFRQTALRFVRYLRRVQDADGSFGQGQYPSAVPQALMYFHDLGTMFHDQELIDARDRTLEALLSMQFTGNGDGALDGAFPAEKPDLPTGKAAGMRTTMYALAALLHIESDQSGAWLSRHNPPFIDPELAEE